MVTRVTDWGFAALAALLSATGGPTLFAGSTGESWVIAAHDAFSAAVASLLVIELRRVSSRYAAPWRIWSSATSAGSGDA